MSTRHRREPWHRQGVALALGDAGAVVYVTGRTTDAALAELPGTVQATAAEVDARGGTGVAVRIDQRDDAQVAALFDRVLDERGRLDLLVNSASTLDSPRSGVSGTPTTTPWPRR